MKQKSYKREFAVVMWLHLVWLTIYGNPEMVNALVWPYTGFILGAFGLQSIATQTELFKKGTTSDPSPLS